MTIHCDHQHIFNFISWMWSSIFYIIKIATAKMLYTYAWPNYNGKNGLQGILWTRSPNPLQYCWSATITLHLSPWTTTIPQTDPWISGKWPTRSIQPHKWNLWWMWMESLIIVAQSGIRKKLYAVPGLYRHWLNVWWYGIRTDIFNVIIIYKLIIIINWSIIWKS